MEKLQLESKVQLTIDTSHEMMEEKFIKLEERFFQKKENIENLKLIQTETGDIKRKLQDLEGRSHE